LGWEDYFNGGKGHNFKETTAFKPFWRHVISLGIVLVTFGLPAAMSLLFFIYLWLQGNSIVNNDITIFLIITDFILLSAFIITLGYYIYKSLKIGQEYRNEKHTVTNEIQQS
jgi:CBS domain containing-hemolysin-like protein